MNTQINENSFDYWQKRYESDKLEGFTSNQIGLLWLKLKSITRRELINEFLATYDYHLDSTSLNEQFIQLFIALNQNLE